MYIHNTYANQAVVKDLATQTASTTRVAATENSNMTGWKTYTNTTYGFSFKYPPDASVSRLSEGPWHRILVMSLPQKELYVVINIITNSNGQCRTSSPDSVPDPSVAAHAITLGHLTYSAWNASTVYSTPRGPQPVEAYCVVNEKKNVMYDLSVYGAEFSPATSDVNISEVERQFLSSFTFAN